MTDEHIHNIQSSRSELVINMEPDEVLDHMLANEILSRRQVEDIKGKERPKCDVNEALVAALVKKSEKAYRVFIESLGLSCQKHLANKVERKKGNRHRKKQNRKRSSVILADTEEPTETAATTVPSSFPQHLMVPLPLTKDLPKDTVTRLEAKIVLQTQTGVLLPFQNATTNYAINNEETDASATSFSPMCEVSQDDLTRTSKPVTTLDGQSAVNICDIFRNDLTAGMKRKADDIIESDECSPIHGKVLKGEPICVKISTEEVQSLQPENITKQLKTDIDILIYKKMAHVFANEPDASKGLAIVDLLREKQREITEVLMSSVIIRILCPTVYSADDLWFALKDGRLKQLSQSSFITPELKDRLRVTSVELEVSISEQQYQMARNKLTELEAKSLLEDLDKIFGPKEVGEYMDAVHEYEVARSDESLSSKADPEYHAKHISRLNRIALQSLQDGNIDTAQEQITSCEKYIKENKLHDSSAYTSQTVQTVRVCRTTLLCSKSFIDGWAAFDRNDRNNCDHCFKKGIELLQRIQTDDPENWQFLVLENLLTSSRSLSNYDFECRDAMEAKNYDQIKNLVDTALSEIGEEVLNNSRLKSLMSALHYYKAQVLFTENNVFSALEEIRKGPRIDFYRYKTTTERMIWLRKFSQELLKKDYYSSHKEMIHRFLDDMMQTMRDLVDKDLFAEAIIECTECMLIAETLRMHKDPKTNHDFMLELYVRRGMSALQVFVLDPEIPEDSKRDRIKLVEDDSKSAMDYGGFHDVNALMLASEVDRVNGKLKSALDYANRAIRRNPHDVRVKSYIDDLKRDKRLATVEPKTEQECAIRVDYLEGTNIHLPQKQSDKAKKLYSIFKKSKARKEEEAKKRAVSRQRQRSISIEDEQIDLPTKSSQCPICWDDTQDLMQVCENKHRVCEECRQKIEHECPLCRQPIVCDAENRKWKDVSVEKKLVSARKLSMEVLALLSKTYDVKLGCSDCCVDANIIEEEMEHSCKKNMLVMKELEGHTWSVVRCKHYRYKSGSGLCKDIAKVDGCIKGTRCSMPHNPGEQVLWEAAVQRGFDQNLFIQDLRDSDLLISVACEKIFALQKGNLKLVCQICFNSGNGSVIEKRRHVPCCENGHPWEKNAIIIYIRSDPSEDNIQIIDCSNTIGKAGVDLKIAEEIQNLVQYGFSYISINQTASRHTIAPKLKHDIEIDKTMLITDADPRTDIKSYERKLEDLEKEINTLFDVCSFDDFNDEEGGDYDYSADSYYSVCSKLDLDNFLKDPNKYKLCTFQLIDLHRAVCKPISNDDTMSSIEIRGRMNCGPSFTGDHVVVAIHTINQPEEEPVVCGRVIGIKKQIFNRKAHVFVCIVDKYQSNLMIPICTSVPKLHILDAPGTAKKSIKYSTRGMIPVAIYRDGEDGLTFTGEQVPINPKDREGQLFLVKYLKWDPAFIYPLGYVACVIPSGSNLAKAQLALSIKYQLPRLFSPDCLEKSEAVCNENIADRSNIARRDLTDMLTFSIDPAGSLDIDDAFSITQLSKNNYMVYVHISDVSEFVEKGDPVDDEAYRRNRSYYQPNGESAVNMLPPKLSNDTLSLLPDQTRLALSVVLDIYENGALRKKPEFIKTVIRNDFCLSYEEAQGLLFDKEMASRTELQGVSQKLKWLYSLAKGLRSERINGGQFFYEINPLDTDRCIETRRLVEEFMVFTNYIVAQHLAKEFPQCILFRRQSPPLENDIKDFQEENCIMQKILFHLRKYPSLNAFLDNESFERLSSKHYVTILLETAKDIDRAFKNGNFQRVQELIGMEEIHPDHGLTLARWYHIQKNAEYFCPSSEVTDGRAGHYSVRKDFYTHFTSPIRRYVDIVVHRLLKASMDRLPCPYTGDEIHTLCSISNVIAKRARSFEKESILTDKMANLLGKSIYLPAIVRHIDDKGLELVFAHTKQNHEILDFSTLDLACKPAVNASAAVFLTWQRRLYDARPNENRLCTVDGNQDASNCDISELDPHLHIVEITVPDWCTIQKTLIAEANLNICREIIVGSTRAKLDSIERVKEITSETTDLEKLEIHQCRFGLNLKVGSTLLIQVAGTCVNGLLSPVMKLVNLTPQLDLCLEHKLDPIKCYAEIATKATKRRYKSLLEYRDIWLPILDMETATTATTGASPIILNNVEIFLTGNTGYFELTQKFCKARFLSFTMPGRDEDNELSEEDGQYFLCIKYAHPQGQNGVWNTEFRNVWVGHAKSILVTLKGNLIRVNFQLHHSASEPVPELKGQCCSVELLTKPLPNREMEKAIHGLENATELCQNIALYRPIGHLELQVPADLQIKVPTLPKNNDSQTRAIRKALSSSLALIQGPPGTGKTLTAIKLAYWFVQMNKAATETGDIKQVLFCGPSNCAVDVATRLLREDLQDHCPRIIRVYSKSAENELFPVPRDCLYANHKTKGYDLKNKTQHRDVDLHHVIREPGKPYSSSIKVFDELFRKNLKSPYQVTNDDVINYQRLIGNACKEELKQYEIILCTCETAASPLLTSSLSPIQCIIDECGMCTEPQTFIPLVAFPSIKQVTLIGDHKQLRPIILNSIAQDLGLEKSLFERYAQNVQMLDEQYRMHPAICEFPSNHFYDGRLRTADSTSWKASSIPIWYNPEYPITFCHVEGKEEVLMVKTEDGNEQSRSNELESNHVAEIFAELVNRYRVPVQSVAVLSQYKAQCSAITENLKARGFRNPTVTTVVASQGGEWDYVILSTVRSLDRYEIEKQPSLGWIKKNMGSIADAHQINVAITRARKGLIILGNQYLLSCVVMWQELLRHYRQRGCLVKASRFPAHAVEDSLRLRPGNPLSKAKQSRTPGHYQNR